MINGTLTNNCYDNMGRMTFIIKVSANEVLLVTKDNLIVNCHRQMSLLQDTLNFMVIFLARFLKFQPNFSRLHVNFCPHLYWQSSIAGKTCTRTPMLIAKKELRHRLFTLVTKLQQSRFFKERIFKEFVLRKMFIQFFTDGRPYQIRIACVSLPQNGSTSESKQENEATSSQPNNFDDPMEDGNPSRELQFVTINNARIPGESFLRKLDYIFTMFS